MKHSTCCGGGAVEWCREVAKAQENLGEARPGISNHQCPYLIVECKVAPEVTWFLSGNIEADANCMWLYNAQLIKICQW